MFSPIRVENIYITRGKLYFIENVRLKNQIKPTKFTGITYFSFVLIEVEHRCYI